MLGAAIVFASGLTYISQTAPEHRRTEAIGVLGAGGFIGMLIGPALGDWLLAERSWDAFYTLFIVAACANVLPGLLLLFMETPASRGTKRSVTLSDFVHTVMRYWPGAILLVDFVFGICMAAPFGFVAAFVDHAHLAIPGVSMIGLFFLVYAGWGITIRLTLRRLPDRIGAPKVLIAGMLFMGTGMFTFALVREPVPWMIVVPAFLTGTGHGLMFHTMTSLTVQTFPNDVRGTGSALALMMLDLGTLLGAPILGWIGERVGFAALFAAIGTSVLLGLVIYIRSLRTVAQDPRIRT